MKKEMAYVIIPQININDKEVYLSQWKVENGSYVNEGDDLVEIETSKKIITLRAETAGYIYYKTGNRDCPVGETIAVITPEKNAEEAKKLGDLEETKERQIKITEKAKKLAEENNIDITLLYHGKLIKEKDIISYIEEQNESDSRDILDYISEAENKGISREKMVVIVGAGDMAKMMIESLQESAGLYIIGCVDRKVKPGTVLLDIPVIGKSDSKTLQILYENGVTKAINSVVGTNFDFKARENVFLQLKEIGFELPVVIHRGAVVEKSAELEAGCFVHANAYVGSSAKIKAGTIVLTGAIVSHDCEIGENVYLSPGCILGGYVKVGDKVLIGMGSTVFARVQIGKNAIIVNGRDVFNNIGEGEKVTL